MSQEHKEALAQGRTEARAIKAYLRALDSKRPGRPVTKESLEARMVTVQAKLTAEDDPLKAVELIQTRLDIEEALAQLSATEDLDALETGFVAHAASYSKRKHITYPAWREAGVAASVLKKAGIPETRRR